MFSCGSVLWSSENTALSLMMQTNLMQNFSALLNHTYNFFLRVNVFADFVPKTGCWIRQCWFYWPSPSESLIYLIIQINPPPSRRGYRPILFPTLCFLFFICFWGSVSHNIFQDNKILNGQIPFRIIQNQSWRSWMFDSAAVYFVISAANKLKSRVFFALTLTLRMTLRR